MADRRMCLACGGASVAPGQSLCATCRARADGTLGYIICASAPFRDIAARRARRGAPSPSHTHPSEAPTPVSLPLLDWEAGWIDGMDALSRLLDDSSLRSPSLAAAARRMRDAGVLDSGVAGEAARGLENIQLRLSRVVDPPAPRRALGLCPECGGIVWAASGERRGECARCGAGVDAASVVSSMAARLATDTRRGLPVDIERLCAREGIRVPAATVRTWIHRGRIEADAAGMVSLAEVARILLERDDRHKGN